MNLELADFPVKQIRLGHRRLCIAVQRDAWARQRAAYVDANVQRLTRRVAYLVLGGEGWTLRSFYTSGGLKKYLVNSDRVEVKGPKGTRAVTVADEDL